MHRSDSQSDTIPLHPSSQSDIDEIENLIHSSIQTAPAAVPSARSPSPPRASIPVSSTPSPSPFLQSNLLPPPSSAQKPPIPPSVPAPPPPVSASGASHQNVAAAGFGSAPNTLTEPVLDTVKRDLTRIVSNLKLVVFPNPYREDPGKALRDWDLWGPFFFIIFLGLVLSWSASVKKSDVFAVAFALLAAGAVILTLNVLLMGGHIIFFQSLSLLGYCLFPLDVGALLCMMMDNVVVKLIVVSVTLSWSSWAAYPFMSTAVNPRRKALALYPVFLMQNYRENAPSGEQPALALGLGCVVDPFPPPSLLRSLSPLRSSLAPHRALAPTEHNTTAATTMATTIAAATMATTAATTMAPPTPPILFSHPLSRCFSFPHHRRTHRASRRRPASEPSLRSPCVLVSPTGGSPFSPPWSEQPELVVLLGEGIVGVGAAEVDQEEGDQQERRSGG